MILPITPMVAPKEVILLNRSIAYRLSIDIVLPELITLGDFNFIDYSLTPFFGIESSFY